jgi:hypothetical protein
VRINDRVVGRLTVAHIASLLAIGIGGMLLRRGSDR